MPHKRANGEGSLYKRKDGRYEGSITLPTAGGSKRRICVYGKTREEAHRKLTKIIEESHRGIPLSDKSYKLSEYLDFWLEREKCRPLTLKRHESAVRVHIKPALGNRRLNTLSVMAVQDFLDELHAEDKSIATIHQVRKVLSAALSYAVRKEIISRNVARLVDLPRYKPKRSSYWTSNETVRFLQAASSDQLYPIFVLLALYGLRRGEVLGIRWCDVDFDRSVLHIRQQVQRIDGQLKQVDLKTDSSERDEPLLARAREVLLKQRDIQEASRTQQGRAWLGIDGSDELVFTTRTGRPLEPHNLARSFKRICEQNSLRRITIHGLRHSNATTQKDLQIHSRDIQAILGHSDVKTTGIYEHVDLTNKRNALEKVEEHLFRDGIANPTSTEVGRET